MSNFLQNLLFYIEVHKNMTADFAFCADFFLEISKNVLFT